MPPSEAQKRANKKWREGNREAYNILNNIHNKKFYTLNTEKVCIKSRISYHYKKENSYEWVAKQFLKILR